VVEIFEHPKLKWSGSLESYDPCLLPQGVSKPPLTSCVNSNLLKIRKVRFGCLSPLGININSKKFQGHILE
jgi:hypothetical protein